ncbi:uncharacterized protein [Centruroides vittatus]|uniref:uncharacterized protein n=1 Tax=Centruroides vittatus TaxID=120091 RepID=UPI00350FF732
MNSQKKMLCSLAFTFLFFLPTIKCLELEYCGDITKHRIKAEDLVLDPHPWKLEKNLSVTGTIIVEKEFPCTALMSVIVPRCGKEMTSEDKTFEFDMLQLFRSPSNKKPDKNCPCEDKDPFKMASQKLIKPVTKHPHFIIPTLLPEGCYDLKITVRIPVKSGGIEEILCLRILNFIVEA